ncbi:hypothetical protein N7478_011549 [Penicillium angulare]|uniref:uncharacterized protein n=1 Tax=Penicillium angulare TaxID=116970 RepID=UPI0025403F98|nr:uncharacterized protein N7478_011549 [Penicillium angulare]KAJ5263944.1 hypothetical protein N7478_011549 [Penicillium angulare]
MPEFMSVWLQLLLVDFRRIKRSRATNFGRFPNRADILLLALAESLETRIVVLSGPIDLDSYFFRLGFYFTVEKTGKEQHPSKANTRWKVADSPLCQAAENGHLEAVKLLVRQGESLAINQYHRRPGRRLEDGAGFTTPSSS